MVDLRPARLCLLAAARGHSVQGLGKEQRGRNLLVRANDSCRGDEDVRVHEGVGDKRVVEIVHLRQHVERALGERALRPGTGRR